MSKQRVALLIDAENISAKHAAAIVHYAGGLGRLVARSAFGDFSSGRLAGWVSSCSSLGLETVMQLSGGSKKNSADMAMTIHALDLLYEGNVDVFCIASSDRDFLPLVQRLVRSDKLVHGIGGANTSDALREVYAGFLKLAPEPKGTACPPKGSSATAEPPTSASDQTESRLVAVLNKIVIADEWLQLPPLSKAIRTHDPIFAATFCGKGKFLKNIRATKLFAEQRTGQHIKVRLRTGAQTSGFNIQ
jgi:hypothetical protein